MNYKNYNIKDFVLNTSFQRWVLFNAQEDCEVWELFITRNPEKLHSITDAKQIVTSLARKVLISTDGVFENFSEEQRIAFERVLEEDIKTFHDFSDKEINEQIDRLALTLGYKSGKKDTIIPFYKSAWFRVAASVLVVIGLGTVVYMSTVSTTPDTILSMVQNHLLERINDTDKTMLVTLSDGSSIILQAHSSISFLENFAGTKREVNLSGEAFFEIAKDKSRPFYVYANGITTKVTGTSFTVRAFKSDKQVKVTVKTGKVTVYADRGKKGPTTTLSDTVDLLPDQQALFGEADTKIEVSLIQKTELKEFSIQQQMFEFNEASIPSVFREMEKAYGVKIISEEEDINNKKITAFLCDKPYFKKLELICKLIDARYEQKDSTVVITANKF